MRPHFDRHSFLLAVLALALFEGAACTQTGSRGCPTVGAWECVYPEGEGLSPGAAGGNLTRRCDTLHHWNYEPLPNCPWDARCRNSPLGPLCVLPSDDSDIETDSNGADTDDTTDTAIDHVDGDDNISDAHVDQSADFDIDDDLDKANDSDMDIDQDSDGDPMGDDLPDSEDHPQDQANEEDPDQLSEADEVDEPETDEAISTETDIDDSLPDDAACRSMGAFCESDEYLCDGTVLFRVECPEAYHCCLPRIPEPEERDIELPDLDFDLDWGDPTDTDEAPPPSECGFRGGQCVYFQDRCPADTQAVNWACPTRSEQCCAATDPPLTDCERVGARCILPGVLCEGTIIRSSCGNPNLRCCLIITR